MMPKKSLKPKKNWTPDRTATAVNKSVKQERMPMSGLFISFDGIDGAGKGTQIRLLAAALQRRGHTVVQTLEPGGSPYGNILRPLLLTPEKTLASGAPDSTGKAPPADALTEVFLFMAERRYHVTSLIAPSLAAGRIVISDRFADSTVVYQGYDQGYDLETIHKLNQLAVGEYWPNCTFFLDLPVEESSRRTTNRPKEFKGTDRFEASGDDAFERRRRGYHELAERFPERIHLIDGGRAEEDIAEEIWSIVEPQLAKLSTCGDTNV